jgi:hypothetical protein
MEKGNFADPALQELLMAQPAVLIGLIARLVGTIATSGPGHSRHLCDRRGRQPTWVLPVIDYETFCKIHDCRERQHLTVAQTARALHLHPRTVGTFDFEPRRPVSRGSVLDPFKPRVTRLLDTYPYSAEQIF